MKKEMLITFLLPLMFSCGGGGGGTDPDNLIELNSVDLLNVNALSGFQDLVAVQYTDTANSGATTGFEATVNLYEQSSLDNSLLISRGSIQLGVGTLYKRTTNINVNSDWISVTLNHNFSDSGWVSLIYLKDGEPYENDLLISISEILKNAAATEDWLLVYYGNTLELYDISELNSPSSTNTYTLDREITDIFCQSSKCILFSSNGYYVFDLTDANSITLTETFNADLSGIERSIAQGNTLNVAGPSLVVGRTRIATLDITDLENIQVITIKDDIEGGFVEYAFDSSATYHYVVTDTEISKYLEMIGGFQLEDSSPIEITSPVEIRLFHAFEQTLYDGRPGITIWGF